MPQFEQKQKPAPSPFAKAPEGPSPAPAQQPVPAPSFLQGFLRSAQESLSPAEATDLFGGMYDGPVQPGLLKESTPSKQPAPAPKKQSPWSTSAMMMDAHKTGMRPQNAEGPVDTLVKKVQSTPPSVDAMINVTSTAIGAVPDMPSSIGAPVGAAKLAYDVTKNGPTVDSALDAAKLGASFVPGLQAPVAMMGLWDGLTMMSGNPQLASNELIKKGGNFVLDGARSASQAKPRPGFMDSTIETDSLFDID